MKNAGNDLGARGIYEKGVSISFLGIGQFSGTKISELGRM